MNEILIKARLEKGYTQEQMAEKLGYKHKSSYHYLEKGTYRVSLDQAKKIARILEIDPMIFFTDEVEDGSTKTKEA